MLDKHKDSKTAFVVTALRSPIRLKRGAVHLDSQVRQPLALAVFRVSCGISSDSHGTSSFDVPCTVFICLFPARR